MIAQNEFIIIEIEGVEFNAYVGFNKYEHGELELTSLELNSSDTHNDWRSVDYLLDTLTGEIINRIKDARS